MKINNNFKEGILCGLIYVVFRPLFTSDPSFKIENIFSNFIYWFLVGFISSTMISKFRGKK